MVPRRLPGKGSPYIHDWKALLESTETFPSYAGVLHTDEAGGQDSEAGHLVRAEDNCAGICHGIIINELGPVRCLPREMRGNGG
jgi:hypothetical protein